MQIKIKIEATANIEIDVSDEIIKEVVTQYGGDLKRWAKENYDGYINSNDFSRHYIEDISFDDKEAKKITKDARMKLGYNEDFNIIKSVVFKQLLIESQADAPTIDDDIEKVENLDMELIRKSIDFVGVHYPKNELNYIYLNGNEIVASNTHILSVFKSAKSLDRELFFPPYFVELLLDGAQLYRKNGVNTIMKHKNQWYLDDGIDKYSKFPDHNRIAYIDESYIHKIDFSDYKNPFVNKSVKVFISDEYFEVIKNQGSIKTVSIKSSLHPICFDGDGVRIMVMSIKE